MIKSNYSTLVLSGGGIKGFLILGSLYYLIKEKNLDIQKINNFIGSSIGGIICLLLSIGYTPMDILCYCCKKDVVESLEQLKIGFLQIFCHCNFEILNNHLEKLIKDKLNIIPTLGELYNITNKNFTCVSYNITDNNYTPEYISHNNYSNLLCTEALKMTSSIPLFFEPCIINGKEYIDGGLVDNFPIKYIDDIIPINENILALNCTSLYSNKIKERTELITKLKYLYFVCSLASKINDKKNINSCNNNRITFIDIESEYDSFEFFIDIESKIEMFEFGYRLTKNKIEKKIKVE